MMQCVVSLHVLLLNLVAPSLAMHPSNYPIFPIAPASRVTYALVMHVS